MSRVALTVQDEIEHADAQWLSQSDSISAMDLLDVSEAPMDTSLDAVVSRMRPWPPLRPSSSSAKRAHENTPEGTHPGAPRPEGQRVRRGPFNNRYSPLQDYVEGMQPITLLSALPQSLSDRGAHALPGSPPMMAHATTADAAEFSPPGTGGKHGRTRMREAELEELLEASNVARAELEAALRDTESLLTAAQLEVDRIQLGDGADIETYSLSSAGSRPSSHESDLEGDVAIEVQRGTFFDKMRIGQQKLAQRTREETAAAAAKDARRKEVEKLKLPTEQQPSWTTADWKAERFVDAERKTQEKRNKPITISAKAAKPRKGKHGWRHNSRQGLVGAVRYWADGSRENVIKMLIGLAEEFEVADAIRSHLFQKASRQAETDKLIVDRLVEALEVLKGCQTEQQRKDYLLALSLVAPPRAAERSGKGSARRIAARLRISRGKRSKRRGERPYAFETAMVRREAFDEAKARYSLPIGPLANGQQRALVPDALQVGEKVLTHNGPAELTRFTEDGGCVVTYRVGDDFAERKYSECYSKAKGSARLRRVPPSLTPPPRARSALSISDSTRKLIVDDFKVTCPTSPCTRDVMRRRTGPFVIQEKVCS